MSMKASVLSSSKIFIEGIWPSRTLQKTQSVIMTLRSDRERPAVGIGCLPVLDGHDGVIEPLGQRPDLAAVDHHLPALVGQLAHRRDDRRGAGSPRLVQ